jgi:hypothetical protein
MGKEGGATRYGYAVKIATGLIAWRSWGFFSVDLSGSSALEASLEARLLSGLCLAPLWLRGLRGEESTPSVWLGGTDEFFMVGERERQGVRGLHSRQAPRKRYARLFIKNNALEIMWGPVK